MRRERIRSARSPLRHASRVAVLAIGLAAVGGCGESRTAGPADGSMASAPWGTECGDTVACGGGLGCVATFPGGYCSRVCEDGTCGAGAVCIPDFGPPLCLATCTRGTDCRDGYQCWAGTCRPPCSGDAQCGSAGATCIDGTCSGAECATDPECGDGRRCVAGRCTAGGTGDLPDGSPCTRSADCMSAVCLPAELGGVCGTACTDRTSCGAFERVCSPVRIDIDGDGARDAVAAACLDADPVGLFLAGACSADSQCESRACVNGQCAEVCDDDPDCLPGQVCRNVAVPDIPGAGYNGCWYRDRTAGVEVVDIPLGDVTATTATPTSRLNFGTPNDTISVTLVARQVGGAALPLSFVDVWTADNSHLFALEVISSFDDPPIRWIPSETDEAIAMLVPNSTPDRVTDLPGRHGFTLAALSRMAGESGAAPLEVVARVKRAAAPVASGTLDLNVYLVGIGLTADQARAHPRLQAALTEIDRILGTAGVHLGAIDYIQVTGSDATTFSIIDDSDGPTSEMARLLRTSSDRTNEAVNVFLVRGISESAGESGGIALGIAGGIPGPPGIHGTMHSGVLVSFDTMVVGDDPRVVAQIASHEIGHFLGLFHNTEGGRACGPTEDPSEANPCAPFGGGDVLADTAYGDGRNLMYYRLGGADGSTYNVELSSGQGFVLTRNPVVR